MAATARSPRSRIRTAMAGCSKRSPRDCPDAWTRTIRHSPHRPNSRPPSHVPPRPATSEDTHPFRTNVPEEAPVDLRRRINATRWPDRETIADESQGVQLAAMQEVARYWATDYDWRKGEAKLNALPQFITEIDGLDIHFIHVRSKHENALPLIVTHGCPGSVIEPLQIIHPLTKPTPPGASAPAASHLDVHAI